MCGNIWGCIGETNGKEHGNHYVLLVFEKLQDKMQTGIMPGLAGDRRIMGSKRGEEKNIDSTVWMVP